MDPFYLLFEATAPLVAFMAAAGIAFWLGYRAGSR